MRWKTEGCKMFFDEMKKTSRWAGDQEITALTDAWGVDVKMEDRSTKNIYNYSLSENKNGEKENLRPEIHLVKTSSHWTYMRNISDITPAILNKKRSWKQAIADALPGSSTKKTH